MKSQFPFGGRHQRTGSHLEACQECAATVRRERQYLERLRDAPIPPASQDLTARLLARTHELAAQPAAPVPPPQGVTPRMAPPHGRPGPCAHRRRNRSCGGRAGRGCFHGSR
ncbi:hypothetical protein ARTHRO8AJ_140089 [Arthrobacter sp. 8AJ]|nr:hypothetical protein ARTHRO8AJ_140089 [Arthrobacter sp. 8AJ]